MQQRNSFLVSGRGEGNYPELTDGGVRLAKERQKTKKKDKRKKKKKGNMVKKGKMAKRKKKVKSLN